MIITDINPNKFKKDLNKIKEEDSHFFDYYKNYYNLHKKFLQPTSIKIDIATFESEISEYHHLFRQWGYNRPHVPRFGISLFNLNGKLDEEEDLASGPLDQLINLGKKVYKEEDFCTPTPVFNNLESLRPLDSIKEYMVRSNILLWHKGANFIPHIDTLPKPGFNLRLWGTNDPEGYIFDYRGEKAINIEPGRIYLVDTTQWHWAQAIKDWNYTFFIALKPQAFNKIGQILT